MIFISNVIEYIFSIFVRNFLRIEQFIFLWNRIKPSLSFARFQPVRRYCKNESIEFQIAESVSPRSVLHAWSDIKK